VVSWGWSISWSWSLWVDSGSLVGDISDISIITVGRVLDVLDSAIRKGNGVRSGNIGSTIGLFLSVEVGLGVVISNSVGVGVGGDLIGVSLNWGMVNWGMVSWGSVDNWGSMDSMGNNWGSMDSMGNWVGNNWGMDSVGNWGMDGMSKNWGMDGMVDWSVDSVDSMGDNSISSVKSVGGISNNSGVGSESLALGGGSVFSLEWLADRLMADLTMAISIDWLVGTIVNWSNSGRHWGVGNWGMDSMGNSHWSSMDSMGNWVSNNWSSVDSMSNNWSSVSNNWGMISWGSMGNHWSSISWGSMSNNWGSLWVGSSALIGDISNISIISIGGVGHSLDSAIRKSNSVRSLDIAGTIRGLLSIEGGL